MFVDVPVKVRHQPWCHFLRTIYLIFWDRLLWDLGLINLTKLTYQWAPEIYLPLSTSPAWGLQAPATILDYYLCVFIFHGHWRSNSGSQAWAHTLMKTCHHMNTHTLTNKTASETILWLIPVASIALNSTIIGRITWRLHAKLSVIVKYEKKILIYSVHQYSTFQMDKATQFDSPLSLLQWFLGNQGMSSQENVTVIPAAI